MDHAVDPQIEVGIEVKRHDDSWAFVTNRSRRSVLALPDRSLVGEPTIDEAQALAVERAGAHAAGLRRADQPTALERVDVLHE